MARALSRVKPFEVRTGSAKRQGSVIEAPQKTSDSYLRSRANTMLFFCAPIAVGILVWGVVTQQPPWLLVPLVLSPLAFVGVSLVERSGWFSAQRRLRAERMVARSAPGAITWSANRVSAWFRIACHASGTAVVVGMAAVSPSEATLPLLLACAVAAYFLLRTAINRYTLTVRGQTLLVHFHPLPAWRANQVFELVGAYGVIAHCYRWRARRPCTLSLVGVEPRVNLPLGKVGSLEEAELIAPRIAELIALATGQLTKSLVLSDSPDRASPKEHGA